MVGRVREVGDLARNMGDHGVGGWDRHVDGRNRSILPASFYLSSSILMVSAPFVLPGLFYLSSSILMVSASFILHDLFYLSSSILMVSAPLFCLVNSICHHQSILMVPAPFVLTGLFYLSPYIYPYCSVPIGLIFYRERAS